MVFKGTVDAAKKIVRREGMRVLWRGTPAALAMAIPQVGIYMPAYEAIKHKLETTKNSSGGGNTNSSSSSSSSGLDVFPALVAGTSARGLAVLITSPLERARTRAQAFSGSTTGGGVGGRSGILHEFGVAARGGLPGLGGLWQGTMATLARDIPFSGIYWVVTERLRGKLTSLLGESETRVMADNGNEAQELKSFKDVAFVNLLAGTAGGVIAASLTTPLDVVKTRIQVDLNNTVAAEGGVKRVSGLRQIGTMMYRISAQEGGHRLFDGMIARAARAAPSCAIVLTSYEVLKKMMQYVS